VTDVLDFGTLTSIHDKKTLPLAFLNWESVPVTITQVKLDQPDSGINFDFSPLVIQPKDQETALSITYSGL
jgi:hypothetical protein